MLWKLLDFEIHRYLLTFIRKQGAERAVRHISISKTIWEVLNMKSHEVNGKRYLEWMAIHDLIADKISNDLPKSIGLDLDANSDQDFDVLAETFFKRLIDLDYGIENLRNYKNNI